MSTAALSICVTAQGDSPAYDGPFDVLLDLIRQSRYPIECLPVAIITGEFLEYIRRIGPMDDELSATFIETASWLVLLKSRSMLPADSAVESSAQEVLRKALLDYEALREPVEVLKARGEYGNSSAADKLVALDEHAVGQSNEITLKEILAIAQRARQGLQSVQSAASLLTPDPVTVENQIAWIEKQLESLEINTAASTEPWFFEQPTNECRAVLFLALLEEAKIGRILLHQPVTGAVILLQRTS